MEKIKEYKTEFWHPEFNKVKYFILEEIGLIEAHIDEFESAKYKVAWLKWLKVKLQNECFSGFNYPAMTESMFDGLKKIRIKKIERYIELFDEIRVQDETSNVKLYYSELTLKTKITCEETISEIFDYLFKNRFIHDKATSDLFRKILANVPVHELNGTKIKWIDSLSIFLALFLGFGTVKIVDGFEYKFDGLIVQNGNYYQSIVNCFEFKQKVTNKVLSNRVARITSQAKIQGLNKLLPLIQKIGSM